MHVISGYIRYRYTQNERKKRYTLYIGFFFSLFDFDIWDKIENGIDYIFGKTSRGREKSEKKVKKTILSHWNLDHHHQLFSEMRLCVLYSFVVVVGLFHISCVFTQHTKQRLQIISIY